MLPHSSMSYAALERRIGDAAFRDAFGACGRRLACQPRRGEAPLAERALGALPEAHEERREGAEAEEDPDCPFHQTSMRVRRAIQKIPAAWRRTQAAAIPPPMSEPRNDSMRSGLLTQANAAMP